MRSVNVARKARLAVACLLGATALTPFGAAGQTWQGGTGTDFNTGANWVGGTPPDGSGTGTFDNTANTTVTVTTSTTIGGLTFSAGATPYTITTTDAAFQSNATNNNSGVLQTIAVNATTVSASFTTFGGNYANMAFTATGAAGILARVNFYGGDLNNAVLTANNRSIIDIRGTTTGGSGTRLVANANGILSFVGLALPSFTAGSIEGAGEIQVSDATLIVGGNNQSTVFSGRIVSFFNRLGGLTKEGTGTLTLTGANDFTAATTISAGTLQLGNGGTMGTLTSTSVVNNATLAFNHSNNTTFGSEISGTGAVTKAGTGTLTLSAANSYQGGTTINAGTISISANNNLGDAAGTLTFGGGTLQTTADITMSRATTLNAGGGTFNVASGTTLTQNSVIGGGGGLTKTGDGTLVLGSANTYQGGTTINGGTLSVSANDRLGDVNGGLTFNGGTLLATASFTMSRATTLNAGGGTFNVSSGLTLNGTIGGVGGLTKTGVSTLVLGGSNTYQGGTTINAGMIQISADNNLGNASGSLAFGGGTLRTSGSFAISRTTTLNAGGGTLDVQSGTLTFNGAISGGGGLIKSGGSTVVLNGASSYQGGTTINAGTISISANNNLGDASGSLTFGGGGGLRSTATFAMSRATTLNAGGGFFDVASATTLTHSGVISGTGRLTKFGDGQLILEGVNTYEGGTTINGGYVAVYANTALGHVDGGLVFDGGTLRALANITMSRATTLNGGGGTFQGTSLTHNGVISGSGRLNFTSIGTLVLTGANSYQGGTRIHSGTISIAANNNLGDASGGLIFSGGGRLGTTATFAMSRATTLDAGGGGFDVASGTTLTQNGVIDGVGGLTKTGAGTLGLIGANTYQGGTTINAGILTVLADNNLGNAAGTLTFNGGTLQTISSFVMSRATTLNAGGGTFDVALGSTLIQNGAIGGAGGLTKTGGGTLTLAGVNTYQGGTTINGGTLFVSSNDRLGNASGGLTFGGGTLMAISSFAMSRATTLNAGGGTILVALSQSLTQNGVIGGTGSLTKTGLGALVLTAVNTYQGGTTINDGTLSVAADGGLGDANGTLAFGGGTLQTTADFTMSRATTLNAGGGTFDVATGTTLTQNGVISGASDLTKIGGGTLILGGVNNGFTGAAIVNAGTLALSGAGSIAASSGIFLGGSGTVFDISLTTGGATISGITDVPLTGSVISLGSKTLTITGGSDFFGNIQDGGIGGGTGGGVTLASGAVLILSGINTYTGATTINDNAVLELDDNSAISSSSIVNLTGTGAVFDISCGCINQQLIKDLQGVVGSTVRLGDNSLTLGTANSTTFAGVIDDFGGNGGLIKQGTGTLTLTGINTYTGGTTIIGGLINFTTLDNFGTGNVTLDGGGVQWATGNTIDISPRLEAIGSNGGTFDTNGNNVTLATTISGLGGITKAGSGTLTLEGANTYGGATTINTGTLALSGNGDISSSSLVTVASGATFDISASSFAYRSIQNLAGSGTVQLGSKGLEIQNASGEFAGTIVDGGLNGGLAITGGTMTLTGVSTYGNVTEILTGATLALKGAGSIANSANITFIPSPGVAVFDISQTTTGASVRGLADVAGVGAVHLGGKTLTITEGTLVYNGVLMDGGIGGGTGGGLTLAANATQSLGGANTYTGATTLGANAVLNLTGNGSIETSSVVNLSAAGAQLNISGSNGDRIILDLVGVAGTQVTLGSNSLSAGSANSTTFAGVIDGSGGFTKEGSGTLTFTGVHTYTGATTINDGTLALSGSGSIAGSSGVVLMAAGATFDITGSTGNQTIQDLWGVADSIVALGNRTLTAGTSSLSIFSGIIADNGLGGALGGSFTKVGSGVLILEGVNTYTGATTISAGTLALENGGRISESSVVTVASGATFDISNNIFNNNIRTLAGAGTVQLGGNVLRITDGSTEFSGVIDDGGAFGGIQIRGGTLTLSGVSTFSGPAEIRGGGTLALKGAGSMVNAGVDFIGGLGTATFDISQTTSGASILGLIDTGFDGGIVSLGSKELTITVGSPFFSGVIQDGGIGGGTGGSLRIASLALQVLTGVNTYTGATTIEGNAALILEGNGSIATSSSLNLTGANALFDIGCSCVTSVTVQNLSGVDSSYVLLGANTLTVVSSVNTTFAGIIEPLGDTGGLTKAGSATLTLAGTNLYTGATTIEAGTLALAGTGSIAPSSGVNLTAAGATFDISGSTINQTIQDLTGVAGSLVTLGVNSLTAGTSNSTIFAGVISGDGGFTKQGSGTLVFTGNNTYTGVTTVSAGTLQLGNDGTSGTVAGNVVIGSGAFLAFNRSDSIVFGGSISGDGAVAYMGPGLVTLTGTSSYTGGTAITGGGRVQIGSDASLGANNSTLTLDDGTLQATANFTSTRAITLGLGGGTVDTNSFDVSLMGAISGGGKLTKTGGGTLFLGGTNTYSGGTTVSGGVLLGTTSSLQGDIVNNATVGFSQNFDGVYAGDISGSGKLIKTGTGTVTLTGANTYAGDTTVSGGALYGTTASLQGNIENNAIVGFDTTTNGTYAGTMSGSGLLTVFGGGTLILTANNTYTGVTAILSGTILQLGNGGTTGMIAGNVSIESSGVLAFNRSDDVTFAGNISGEGAVAYMGPGVVTLTGSNTYTGGTAVSGGTVQAGSDSAFGAAGKTLTVVGGTIQATASFTIARPITLTTPGGTFDTNGNQLTLEGAISGSGRLTKTGAGTLILDGTNSYTGGTTVSAGTLQGTTSSLQGEIVNNAAVVFDQSTNGTYAGDMSGTGSLTLSGNGNLTLTGANTYSGGTTVSGGTLTGTTTSLQGNIANNAAVVFNQSTNGTYAGSMSGAGGLTLTGTGNVTLTGANTYTGGTTVSAGTLTGTTTSLQGSIANNAAVVFNQSSNGTYAGSMSGTGSLTLSGNGNVTLTGANTYTGGTTVSGGTLTGNTASLQGNVTNNAAVVFNKSTNGTYAGTMSGSGSLTKTGAGTLILTANNTYAGATTISGGMLQLGNGGTTGMIAGNVTNNGVLAFNRSDSVVFTGNISGSGSVTYMGPGTVTLTGSSTYTGGTLVSGGTVQASSDSTFGASNSTLTLAGGTVQATASFSSSRSIALTGPGGTFDTNGNTLTLHGAISGTGGLTKSGAGTLALTGANTYTGGTTVSGGTLSGTTSSLQGNIVNNAAVVFNQSTAGTYAGNMSGTGGLALTGTANVTLTGINSYSGGTTVSGGTLTGNTASLQGNIVNNAALVFDQSTNGTYAGAMSGTGSLTKTGAGQLILTGNNVVGGGTTVSAGLLTVNGNLTSNVVVGSGGMVGGSGTIIGQFASNGGTLAPGNSIGTLNVTGTFSQTGGVYQVEVNNAGQSDKIVASGTATIGGGATVQVLAASGTYQRNTTYTIVTATGGLTGTYSGVTSNLAFLTPSLSYDANNVYLLLAQTASAFASGAQTRNQYAVGTALDIASPTATGDFNTVLNALAGLNTQQGPAALDAISGQPYTGFGTVNVGASLVFMNTLGQQVAQARNGSGPGTTRVALAEACVAACDSQDLPKWGAWISGLGGFGSVGGNTNAGTLTYNLGGAAVGVDYRLDPRFLVGLAVGYSSGRQWVNGFMGNGNADTYSAALYASFTANGLNGGGLYVDALAGYAYSDNRMQRVMAIPGLATRIASGQTGANQFLGQIEAGYRMGLLEAAQATLTPFVRFQTVAVSQNGFTESGAQSLNLGVVQQNTTSVRTVIGADLGANIPVGMARPLGVTIRLGWAHEYADTSRPMTAAFAGAPAVPFTVYGAQPLRDAAVVGLGLNAQIGASTSIYARYDGEITGRDDTHAISAGFRMTW
jgi:fibronectin-binding autotransporter adhesin